MKAKNEFGGILGENIFLVVVEAEEQKEEGAVVLITRYKPASPSAASVTPTLSHWPPAVTSSTNLLLSYKLNKTNHFGPLDNPIITLICHFDYSVSHEPILLFTQI